MVFKTDGRGLLTTREREKKKNQQKNSRQGHIRGPLNLSLNHADPIDEKKLAFETEAMVSPMDPLHHQLHRNLANSLQTTATSPRAKKPSYFFLILTLSRGELSFGEC